MVGYNGPERRKNDHDCSQAERLEHIEDDVMNHKIWRSETSKKLTNIEIMLATLNERLRSKMSVVDDHIKAGTAFRTTLIITIIAMVGTIFGAVMAYGKMSNMVETNTKRWDRLLTADGFIKHPDRYDKE